MVGVAFIVLLYSGTFLNLPGLRGLFETFTPWTKTGMEAAGHAKPEYDLFTLVPNGLAAVGPFAKLRALRLNWYWIKLFTVYEWFALAGVVLSLAYLFTGRRALRFLAAYAWLTLIAYSLIPYKTPWCVISIAWPFFFLGAAGLVWLRRLVGLVPVAAVTVVVDGATNSLPHSIIKWRPPPHWAKVLRSVRHEHLLCAVVADTHVFPCSTSRWQRPRMLCPPT